MTLVIGIISGGGITAQFLKTGQSAMPIGANRPLSEGGCWMHILQGFSRV